MSILTSTAIPTRSAFCVGRVYSLEISLAAPHNRTAMFRFVTPPNRQPLASTSQQPATRRRKDDGDDQDQAMLDDLDSSATSHGAVTGPGEVIADAHRWMRSVISLLSSPWVGLPADSPRVDNSGHGTYVQDDKVYASVAGTLERVNKLVTVKPLRTRSVSAHYLLRDCPHPSSKLTSNSSQSGTEAKSETSSLAG